MKNPQGVKDSIILAVFDYMDTKNENFKEKAQSQLLVFANFMHETKKKTKPIQLKEAFRQFISNDKGYRETIFQLYYSL